MPATFLLIAAILLLPLIVLAKDPVPSTHFNRMALVEDISTLLITSTLPSHAVEKRCGWLHNPTPANWSLDDRDGSWTISEQGGYSINDRDWERMPKINQKQFIKTNIHYGYCCMCLSVSVDKKKNRIVRIYGGQQRPIRKCREDKALPKP